MGKKHKLGALKCKEQEQREKLVASGSIHTLFYLHLSVVLLPPAKQGNVMSTQLGGQYAEKQQ